MTPAELAAVAKWFKDAAAGTFRDPTQDSAISALRLTREPDASAYRLVFVLAHEMASLALLRDLGEEGARRLRLPESCDLKAYVVEPGEREIRRLCSLLTEAFDRS